MRPAAGAEDAQGGRRREVRGSAGRCGRRLGRRRLGLTRAAAAGTGNSGVCRVVAPDMGSGRADRPCMNRVNSARYSITSRMARIPAEARRFASTIVKSAPLVAWRVHNARKRSRAGPHVARARRERGPPRLSGHPARQDRGRASIGRAAVTGRRSDGRGAVRRT
ncbi:hypothetical protein EMIT0111MI5_50147 [Burkholderia sp. IT-111MI5]